KVPQGGKISVEIVWKQIVAEPETHNPPSLASARQASSPAINNYFKEHLPQFAWPHVRAILE
ncbi:MAG TPA: hypothetical protein VMA13_04015, partial [Candidatus Saccharimonadales bacterium]|nr:hypothetical protein [Candidatus Saccharimonadales bacterium]